MNWKKGLTIGLLTITAIGLVGCAVILGKKNQAYKPKVQEAAAYYNVETYNFDTKSFTIKGHSRENLNLLDENKGIKTLSNYEYTITYNGQNTSVNIETTRFINYDLEEWELIDPLSTQFNFFRTKPNSITITEYIENTDYITYIVNINNQQQIRQTTIGTPEITIYESDEIETEYATFNQTINLIENQYQTGFTTGYQNKGDLIDGNFIDIRNMMLSVLTMPFTFINQAFDVTLWEGTAYEFNVGNFIKGLIAIAAILFIIRLFTSGFSIIGNYAGDIRARNDTSKLRRSQTELNKAKTEKTKNSTTKKE